MAVSSVTIPAPPTLPQVDSEDVPDYYTIIKNPMDLSTMREKLYDGEYTWCVVVGQRARVSSDHAWLRLQQLTQTHVLPRSVDHMLDDLRLIADNAEEYNPNNEQGR